MTAFPAEPSRKATEIYHRLSKQPNKTFYLHGDFHPGNVVTADRSAFLAIDPKGIIGHIGYDLAVFLNNLHWWQRESPNVEAFLNDAVTQFSESFQISESEIREWAFAYMVIGAWWNFEDMPEHYDGDVAMTDIWGV
jgi:streptomycin 6-kinase